MMELSQGMTIEYFTLVKLKQRLTIRVDGREPLKEAVGHFSRRKFANEEKRRLEDGLDSKKWMVDDDGRFINSKETLKIWYIVEHTTIKVIK